MTNVIWRTNSGSRGEVARDPPHVRGLPHADAGEHAEVAERQLDRERQAGRRRRARASPCATASASDRVERERRDDVGREAGERDRPAPQPAQAQQRLALARAAPAQLLAPERRASPTARRSRTSAVDW